MRPEPGDDSELRALARLIGYPEAAIALTAHLRGFLAGILIEGPEGGRAPRRSCAEE
jgi:hypothetical protein